MRWAAAALLAGAALSAAAQGLLLTLVEGDAFVIDGAHRLAATPGLRVGAGTIVETGPAAMLTRVEWPDGSVVDLGPATKAMLQPPGFASPGGQAPALYLLQGWAKRSGSADGGGVLTPVLDLPPFAGSAVLMADRHLGQAFAEGGAMEVVERAGRRRVALPAGQFYSAASASAPSSVLARPPAEWLARVPRPFRDPIPHRAAAFKDRSVTATALPAPGYAAMADWLAAEPALRHHFPQRFGPWAADPAFRRDLLAHLGAHPEWGPVLNPAVAGMTGHDNRKATR